MGEPGGRVNSTGHSRDMGMGIRGDMDMHIWESLTCGTASSPYVLHVWDLGLWTSEVGPSVGLWVRVIVGLGR